MHAAVHTRSGQRTMHCHHAAAPTFGFGFACNDVVAWFMGTSWVAGLAPWWRRSSEWLRRRLESLKARRRCANCSETTYGPLAMPSRFAFGPFLFDAARGTLLRDGAPLPLGGRALLVLQALLEARGQVVDKARLTALGWPGLVVEESNLSVQIAALRKVLGPAPDNTDWIATVPRAGYRLAGSVLALDGPEGAAAESASSTTHAHGQRPSVAVLPFVNLSEEPAQDYFVDGMTDDVIAALTRFRWFFVAGRSPSYAFKSRQVDAKQAGHELGVRYLVQGSVRRVGDRVRTSVELIDAVSGHCVWADRYDF